MEMPYTLVVYDKDFRFVGWVGRVTGVEGGIRHNLVSTASFMVDDDHPRAKALLEPGARVLVFREEEYQLGGWVQLGAGTFAVAGQITFSVSDDFQVLFDWLGWPKPGEALTGQTVEYRTVTGPAETVVKTLVRENAVRLGFPLTTAPDQGRGAKITATFRFHPLYDRLFPAVDLAGIGVTVRQIGNGLVLDCYEPRTYKHELTPGDATVVGGTYSLKAPSATRVVVGGQGEGVLREFKGYPDLARESAWGRVIEVFRDARDSEQGDVYAERAAESLAEGAPMSALSLVLAETKHFQYGGAGLHRGDKVTAVVNGIRVTDTLREVQLSFGGDGDVATPIIGDRTDDPSVTIAKQIRALKRGDRDRMAR